jgi:hypothetical protein
MPPAYRVLMVTPLRCGAPVVGCDWCWLHVIYPSFLRAWPVSGVALRLALKARGLLSLGAGNLRSNP